jgi:hypothetical protein
MMGIKQSQTLRVMVLCAVLLTPILQFGFPSHTAGQRIVQAAASDGFSFTAVGDIGTTANSDAVLGGIAAGSAFTLALGDFSYNSNPESEWCDYVKSYVGSGYPFQLVSGNHEDTGTRDGYIRSFASCLPDRLASTGDYGVEYYFDYGGLVRIIMVSPDLTIDGVYYDYNSGPRRVWLEDTISQARVLGTPWVVVGMHKVCVSVGDSGCEIGSELASLLAGRVDLVFQGHDHNYQRSHQLSCVVADTVDPACIADVDGAHSKGQGAIFVVAGVGGDGNVPVHMGSDSESGYFAAADSSTYGFVRVTVTASRLDAVSVPRSEGTFVDSFTITADGEPVPLIASFSVTPAFPLPGQITTFTAIVLGGVGPYSFLWDFGDGGTGSDAVATHTFGSEGDFAVVLSVTDSVPQTAVSSRVVSVRLSPPALIETSFRFVDPFGADLSGVVAWEVWNGSSLVTTEGSTLLDPARSYELRAYFRSYLLVTRTFVPDLTVLTSLYVYSHSSVAGGRVAFNSTIVAFSVLEESIQRLRFNAEAEASPGGGFRIVVSVPRSPVIVQKDGAGFGFAFDEAAGVVVVDTSSLSVWSFVFDPPSQPPPLPPGQPGSGGDCPICALPSGLVSWWFLVVGLAMGLVLVLAVMTVKARSRLDRLRRPVLATLS